jgi:hypothetical protein
MRDGGKNIVKKQKQCDRVLTLHSITQIKCRDVDVGQQQCVATPS